MTNVLQMLAAIGIVVGAVCYIRSIQTRSTVPHVGTWVVWTALTALTALGMWRCGTLSPMIVIALFFDVIIVFLALRYGTFTRERVDQLCLGGAGVGLILYLATDVPQVAIIVGTVTNCLGAIPTFRKTWHQPEQENPHAFLIGSLACIAQLLAVPHWNLEHALQPAGWLFNNVVILSLIFRGRLMTTPARANSLC